MGNSVGESLNNATGDEIKRKIDIEEDEINLADYFLVLWKWKKFILLAAILPTLIFGIVFLLLSRDYKVTYVYDVAGDEKLDSRKYEFLLSRFYSEENLETLINKIRENGFDKYAEKLSNAVGLPEKYIKFETVPHFPDISKLDVDQLNKANEINALLLKVIITCDSDKDIYKISSLIRNNIENVIPLYKIRKQLLAGIESYNNNIADIEYNRFNLEIALKNINEVLAGLKKVSVGIPVNKQDNIALQFNVGEQSQYLPLDYQIQAAESQRIELEEKIKTNEEKYEYYKDLLNLNNRIFAEMDKGISTGNYTIEKFKSSLTALVGDYEKPQLKDYLNSYARKIENRISAGKPVTERPKIYRIAKGTAKKTGIVFMIAIMIAVFAAFLQDGIEKRK